MGQFLAGYLVVVNLTPPLQLKIFRTPAENNNVAENSAKNVAHMAETFFVAPFRVWFGGTRPGHRNLSSGL